MCLRKEHLCKYEYKSPHNDPKFRDEFRRNNYLRDYGFYKHHDLFIHICALHIKTLLLENVFLLII